MTSDRLPTLIESLLFVADGPVPLAKIERALDRERGEVEAALDLLAQDLAARGIRLQRLDGRVQLTTAPEAAPYVERFLGLQSEPRLSPAALEVLAIVAYRQPITRAGIEAIRGVNSDRAVASLLARGLIGEVGRAETAGRPTLLGTTFAFLEYFGLSDLAELPPLDAERPTGAALKGEENRGGKQTAHPQLQSA